MRDGEADRLSRTAIYFSVVERQHFPPKNIVFARFLKFFLGAVAIEFDAYCFDIVATLRRPDSLAYLRETSLKYFALSSAKENLTCLWLLMLAEPSSVTILPLR
jgi:hypothetical protein